MKTLEHFYRSKHLTMLQESYRAVLPIGGLFENEHTRGFSHGHRLGELAGIQRHGYKGPRRRFYYAPSCEALNDPDNRECTKYDRRAAVLSAQILIEHNKHRRCEAWQPIVLLYKCRGAMAAIAIPIYIPSDPILGVIGYLYGGTFWAKGDDTDYNVASSRNGFRWFVHGLSPYPEALRDKNHNINTGFCVDETEDNAIIDSIQAERKGEFRTKWDAERKVKIEDSDIVKQGIDAFEEIVRELFIKYDPRPSRKEIKVEGLLSKAVEIGKRTKSESAHLSLMNHGIFLEEMQEHDKALRQMTNARQKATSAGDTAVVRFLDDRMQFTEILANTKRSNDQSLIKALLSYFDARKRPQHINTSVSGAFLGTPSPEYEEKERILLRPRTLTGSGRNFLIILQRWNSYTPHICLSGPLLGGGMFLHWEGTGIVIDPGVGFLSNFFIEGFSLEDIDLIICTHDHDDHTADVIPLFSLLHRRVKAGSVHKVDLLLSASCFAKFEKEEILKSKYVDEVVELSPQPKGIWTYKKNPTIRIYPTRAFHHDRLSNDYAIGLLFDLKDRRGSHLRAWYTGDTGFLGNGNASANETNIYEQTKNAPLKKSRMHLLIANIGSITAEEFSPLTDPEEKGEISAKAFCEQHLGMNGVLRLLQLCKPVLTVIAEFGEEIGYSRPDIAEILHGVEPCCTVLPGDIGLKIVWPYAMPGTPMIRCVRPDGEYDYHKIIRGQPCGDRKMFYAHVEDVSAIQTPEDMGLLYSSRTTHARYEQLARVAQSNPLKPDYAKSFPQGIKGWQFPENVVEKANRDGDLLTMDIETNTKCDLNCKYCFAKKDSRQPKDLDPMDIGSLKEVLRAAADSGLKSAKLIGRGEPFSSIDTLDLLEFSSSLGIWTVVFTNGIAFGDPEYCRRALSLLPDELAQRLYELNVSLMVKMHSLDAVREEALVGYPGFSYVRNDALARLIDSGFNKPLKDSPFTPTRLGIENVLLCPCSNDAEDIYSLRFTSNIYVDVDPPIPIGRTANRSTMVKRRVHMPPDEYFEIAASLYRMNSTYVDRYSEHLYRGASPYFGGVPCTQLPNGLYVNLWGDIYPCCGCNMKQHNLGNIKGNKGLYDVIRNAMSRNPFAQSWKRNGNAYDGNVHGPGAYHGCPYRERAGVMPPHWEKVIEDIVGA